MSSLSLYPGSLGAIYALLLWKRQWQTVTLALVRSGFESWLCHNKYCGFGQVILPFFASVVFTWQMEVNNSIVVEIR